MAEECVTEDLLARLLAANSPKDYLDQEDIADRKLPDYLFELLDEKDVKRADAVRASGLHPTVVYDIFAGKSLPGRDNAIMLAFAPRMRATRRCCTMRTWCPCICARSSSALALSSRARAIRRSSSSVRPWMQFGGESGSHQMPTRFQPLATARGGAVLTAGAVAVLRVLLSKPGISLPRVRRTVQMRRPQGARRFARRRPPRVRRVATTPPADQVFPSSLLRLEGGRGSGVGCFLLSQEAGQCFGRRALRVHRCVRFCFGMEQRLVGRPRRFGLFRPGSVQGHRR